MKLIRPKSDKVLDEIGRPYPGSGITRLPTVWDVILERQGDLVFCNAGPVEKVTAKKEKGFDK